MEQTENSMGVEGASDQPIGAVRQARGVLGALLSWFGIVGGAFTLFSNVSGFLQFAAWVHDAVTHWQQITHGFAAWALSFLPLVVPDEVIGPFLTVLLMVSISVGGRLSGGKPVMSVTTLLGSSVFLVLMVLAAVGAPYALLLLFKDLPMWVGLMALTAWTIGLSVASILFLRRSGISPAPVTAAVLVVGVSVALTPGDLWTRIAVGAFLVPLMLLVSRPGALIARSYTMMGIASIFVAIAALTLIPVPTDLQMSGFFAKG